MATIVFAAWSRGGTSVYHVDGTLSEAIWRLNVGIALKIAPSPHGPQRSGVPNRATTPDGDGGGNTPVPPLLRCTHVYNCSLSVKRPDSSCAARREGFDRQ